MSIRLNDTKKIDLKRFASEIIFKELQTLEFYKQFMKFRRDFGKEIYDYLKTEFQNNEIEIFNKIISIIKYTNKLYFVKRNCIEINQMSDKTDIRHPKYHFNLELMLILRQIPFPKLDIYVLSVDQYNYNVFPKDIINNLMIYYNMVNDIICFMQHERCPYDLLIEKKRTLDSLIKVWPAAIKFKDEWEPTQKEEKVIKMACGLMSEEEAIKKINKG